MNQLLMLTVAYTIRDTITFYKKVNIPDLVTIVTLMYGDTRLDLFIENKMYDLDKDCYIRELSTITDNHMTVDEIKAKLPGWTTDLQLLIN